MSSTTFPNRRDEVWVHVAAPGACTMNCGSIGAASRTGGVTGHCSPHLSGTRAFASRLRKRFMKPGNMLMTTASSRIDLP